jgi:hypothetical protein
MSVIIMQNTAFITPSVFLGSFLMNIKQQQLTAAGNMESLKGVTL